MLTRARIGLPFCLLLTLGVHLAGADAAPVAPAAAQIPPPTPTEATASFLLALDGHHVTVAVLPHLGDGTLAVALSRAGVGSVYGCAADPAQAQRARKAVNAAGRYPIQVIVDTGSIGLPLASGLAELVAIDDATDATLASIDAAEIVRVLAYARGVALIGARGSHAGLSRAALERWSHVLTSGSTAVQEDQDGLWLAFRRSSEPGADDWSHFNHGADGNPVSQDTALTDTQITTQWYDGPLLSDKWGTYVAAGGRIFWVRAGTDGDGQPQRIIARSLANGGQLWNRPIAPDFGFNGSLVIATGDRVFLKDGAAVLALDAETGAELGHWVLGTDAQAVRWILLEGGTLLALLGPPVDAKLNEVKDQRDSFNLNDVGEELVAIDSGTGHERWRWKAPRIDPHKLVVCGDRVFCYADRDYAACLDLSTGAERWRTEAPIVEPLGKGMDWWWAINDVVTPTVGAVATPKVYVINWRPHLQSMAFDAVDGHLLWSHMKGHPSDKDDATHDAMSRGGMLPYWLVMGDTIYTHSMWIYNKTGSSTVSLLTGKDVPNSFHFNYHGCGHFTSTAAGLFLGQLGSIYDASKNAAMIGEFSKSACGVSVFAADGFQIKVPSSCPSCGEWRGFIVNDNVTALPSPRAPFVAGAPARCQASADASDWSMYRHDLSRSAASPVSAPTTGVVAWIYNPRSVCEGATTSLSSPGSGPPTTALAVGDRVIFGTADGSVVCLDSASGGVRWRWLGEQGRILATPTWADGRVYVGGEDGWLSCLDGDDGHLVWQARIAPADRRIVINGALASDFPILCSPLVHGGQVFVAAGLIHEITGSVLVALDAVTGAEQWRDVLTGSSPHALGEMAWYHDELWWKGGAWGIAIVDPKTGKWRSALDGGDNWAVFEQVLGKDISIMPGGWIGLGGRQIFTAPTDGEQSRNMAKFLPTDGAGAPQLPAVQLVKLHQIDHVPPWDAQGVLVEPDDVHPAFIADFGAFLDGLIAKSRRLAVDPTAVTKPGTPRPNPRQDSLLPATAPGVQIVFAQKPNVRVHSPILAANAIIAVGGHDTGYTPWHVLGIDRTANKLTWTLPLPAQPVFDELSMTRDGRILVPLINGMVVCVGDASSVPSLEAVAPAAKPTPGLVLERHLWGAKSLPPADLVDLEPVASTEVVQSTNGIPSKKTELQLLRAHGEITLPSGGLWLIDMYAEGPARLMIDGREICSCYGWSSSCTERGQVKLDAGAHHIVFDRLGFGNAVNLNWASSDLKFKAMPLGAFSHSSSP